MRQAQVRGRTACLADAREVVVAARRWAIIAACTICLSVSYLTLGGAHVSLIIATFCSLVRSRLTWPGRNLHTSMGISTGSNSRPTCEVVGQLVEARQGPGGCGLRVMGAVRALSAEGSRRGLAP